MSGLRHDHAEFKRQFYKRLGQPFLEAFEQYLEGKFYEQTSTLLLYEHARGIFKSNQYMRPREGTVDEIRRIRANLDFFKHGIAAELKQKLSEEITRTIRESVKDEHLASLFECKMEALKEQTTITILNFDYTQCEASMGTTLYTKIRDWDWVYERDPVYGELAYEDFERSMGKIGNACAHKLHATPGKVVVQELVNLFESKLGPIQENAQKQLTEWHAAKHAK